MRRIIVLGVGMILVCALSVPALAISDKADVIDLPPTLQTMSNMSSTERAAQAPMTGDQLAAIKGMAGICVSCLNESIDGLIRDLVQRQKYSGDREAATLELNEYVIGSTPADIIRGKLGSRTMTHQTFNPSRKKLTVVQIQQLIQHLRNTSEGSSLTPETITNTQILANQNLNLQNLPQQQNIPQGSSLAQPNIPQNFFNSNLPGGRTPF